MAENKVSESVAVPFAWENVRYLMYARSQQYWQSACAGENTLVDRLHQHWDLAQVHFSRRFRRRFVFNIDVG